MADYQPPAPPPEWPENPFVLDHEWKERLVYDLAKKDCIRYVTSPEGREALELMYEQQDRDKAREMSDEIRALESKLGINND